MKLTIIGGGGFRVPDVYRALLADTGSPRITEVWLYDVGADRLEAVRAILASAARRAVTRGADATTVPAVHATTDLDAALSDADFVFSAIRVGGLAGRVADERVALALGLLGQETVGPGGISYGLRTVPVMTAIAERIAAVAPRAILINFTNPAGMITEALQRVLGDRAVGICDTPSGLGRRIAAGLGIDPREVQLDYAGLNHLGWLRRVLHRGEDVLPRVLADDALLGSLEEGAVFGVDALRTLGTIPNEYLYYYYCNRDAVPAILERPRTRGEQLVVDQADFFAKVRGADDPWQLWQDTSAARSATYMAEAKPDDHVADAEDSPFQGDDGYAGVALSVMRAVARDEPATLILNVRNGGTIPGMPVDAVVEVPVRVSASGMVTQQVTQPDLHQLGLMQQLKACERYTIDAALSGSRAAAEKAFALHPLVQSLPRARALLDGYTREIPEVAAALAATSGATHSC